MAIFNSYVKLPEGIQHYTSQMAINREHDDSPVDGILKFLDLKIACHTCPVQARILDGKGQRRTGCFEDLGGTDRT